MSIVRYSIPLGDRPAIGTRDRLVSWLEEHVGPITQALVFYERYERMNDEFFFVQQDYYETCGLHEYFGGIYKIGLIVGEGWCFYQLQIELQGFVRFSYQYVVKIDDELLAMQYKLACL